MQNNSKHLIKSLVIVLLLVAFSALSRAQNRDTLADGDPIVKTYKQELKENVDLQIKVFSLENKIEEQKIYKMLFLFSGLFILLASLFVVFLLLEKIKKSSNDFQNFERELKVNKLQNEQLSLILNNIENSVLIAMPDGEISWINEGFKSMYGYSIDDLKSSGKSNIRNFVDNDKDVLQIEKCISEKNQVGYSGETTDMFGSKIWFQRNFLPILNSEKIIISIVAVDNDLTMVKLAMNEINTQKKKVEEQKNKITDSITYAGYIQQALLPAQDYCSELLNDYFIFFRPRDIVSGDFYWLKKIDNFTVVVAADCTGHGVPGALMSVLGVSLLNDIFINDFQLSQENPAGEILNKLRTGIIEALNQAGSKKTKDGMDISLCIFDETFQNIHFAGANNSGLILRKTSEGQAEFVKMEADRMPVGVYFKENKSFTTKTYDLQKNDRIFIFSDGYIDQFGGDTKTKFMIKRLRDLISANIETPLNEHKAILETAINDWMKRGKEEQVDDMIVIGIQI